MRTRVLGTPTVTVQPGISIASPQAPRDTISRSGPIAKSLADVLTGRLHVVAAVEVAGLSTRASGARKLLPSPSR
ncbi:MAG: hypothetical protein HN396_14650 [Gemmatimonadales bacterium]|nr:hypothetical protein [Gemmatimonadales bacterium]